MSLLQLPPELLIQILDYVGPSYFRSDLSRLTVCKQWSKFARTACFRDTYLDQKTLKCLMSSPYVEPSLSVVKDSVETLDVGLQGFEDWDPIPPSVLSLQTVYGYHAAAWDNARGQAVRAAWTTEMNKDLLDFASIIKQARKLRNLRIQAISELHPLRGLLSRRHYLFQSTICAFLSVDNLSSLELDLCGTQLITSDSEEYNERLHVCTSIGALLTTLRRLRLRMRTICADILKPPHNSTKLRLNEVIIKLSLTNESPSITSMGHAKRCDSYRGDLLRLQAAMEKQAQDLVAQMAAPKTVRIITHTLPDVQMRAFDVLTGQIVTFDEYAEWDDPGKPIEDAVTDEESEISDLSPDSDE